MKGKIIKVLLFMTLLTTGLSAIASTGTVGKPYHQMFQIYDASGNRRTNCVASRFNVKAYRNHSAIAAAWRFRNFSTGDYCANFTPALPGPHTALINYSGIALTTLNLDVLGHNLDTQHAAQGVRFGILSGMVSQRPTNPLLTNDGRLPATAIAASSEVAKSADWTAQRAAKIDNLDTTVSSRATISGVWSSSGRTLSNYSGVDDLLTATHGNGLWSAAGSVNVLPFQGAASHETIVQGREVHVVRGDSAVIPYNIGQDLTGWAVWFGAKGKSEDTAYAVPLRESTAYVTDPAQGVGLISLSTTDTSVAARRYLAELEIRRAGEVNTVLRFYLWIDADVIR